MKKLVVLLLLFPVFTSAQNGNDQDIEAIKAVLIAQKDAWNNYDIDTFMKDYWKSDDLAFYGSGGVIKGWQATLQRYKKAYPSREHFGTLDFVFNESHRLTKGHITSWVNTTLHERSVMPMAFLCWF